MNDPSATFFRRTAASSAVVGAITRLVEGSLLCAPFVAAVRWQRRTQQRIIAGLGGRWTAERERRVTEAFSAFVADSRVLSSLSSLMAASETAVPAAASTRMLTPILQPDLAARVRVIGSVLIVAVLTQSLWLTASGISGHMAGWSVRIGVLLAGLLAVSRPDALAAAVRDRSHS